MIANDRKLLGHGLNKVSYHLLSTLPQCCLGISPTHCRRCRNVSPTRRPRVAASIPEIVTTVIYFGRTLHDSDVKRVYDAFLEPAASSAQ